MLVSERHSSPKPQHQDTTFDSQASRKRTAALCIGMDNLRPDSSGSEKDTGKALGKKYRTLTYVSGFSDTPRSEWPVQTSNLHYPSPPPSAFDYTRNEDAPVGLLRLSLARCPRVPGLVTYTGRCLIARQQPREAKVTTPDRDTGDHTALHKAASRGHYPLVQSLIENGADPSARDITGRTALHEAASAGHEAVVRLLLDKGADLSAQDNNLCTALHEAASAGHEAVTRLLLEKEADIPAQDSNLFTQIHRATPGDYTGAVKLLLEDTHLSAQGNQRTALQFAAFKGHDAVIQWLLGDSDVLYSQGSEGRTALQAAASGGHGAAELLEGRPTQNQDLDPLEFLPQLYTRSYVISGDSPSQKRSCCFSDDDILDFDSIADDWEEGGDEDELEEEGSEREVDLDAKEESFCDDDDDSSFGYSSDQEDNTNSTSCATDGKGKGKRIADISREDGEGQDLSAKRAKKNSQANRQDIGGKKITKPFVRSSSARSLTEGRARSYACPYFKYNSREYQSCAMWNNQSIDRLREHSIKCHLKPIQCLNCGIYRTGDNDRMSAHHLLGNCERAAEIIPIDDDVIVKGEDLNKRGLNWEQIYKILFPECPKECIPSPYWKNPVEALGAYTVNEQPFSPQARTPTHERAVPDLANLSRYIQSQYPRLFHEYQESQGLQYHDYQPPLPGNSGSHSARSAHI